jgi:hypothetical protein
VTAGKVKTANIVRAAMTARIVGIAKAARKGMVAARIAGGRGTRVVGVRAVRMEAVEARV